MNVVVLKEEAPGERRVALVPAHISLVANTGCSVLVESGAGVAAGYPDEAYRANGATVTDRETALRETDLLLAVRAAAAVPDGGIPTLEALPQGATVIGMLDPYRENPAFGTIHTRRLNAISLERIPRITRAQSMDVLSSQANLAGYRAVLLAGLELPKIFPMMMTAAGTVVPSKVFVVGVGVAGLQAIATAKRLGAVVSAFDIRPAVKEQVQSLGARFVEIDLESEDTEASGGYAREMDETFYRKQREKMLEVVAESDVVITTAAIPGKKAPILVTREMVEAMPPGSVIVDLAAERGGNCELTTPNEMVEHNNVRIIGPVNVPSGIAYHASQLFSKNVTTYLQELVFEGSIVWDMEDEIVATTRVIANGFATSEEMGRVLGIPYNDDEGAPDDAATIKE